MMTALTTILAILAMLFLVGGSLIGYLIKVNRKKPK